MKHVYSKCVQVTTTTSTQMLYLHATALSSINSFYLAWISMYINILGEIPTIACIRLEEWTHMKVNKEHWWLADGIHSNSHYSFVTCQKRGNKNNFFFFWRNFAFSRITEGCEKVGDVTMERNWCNAAAWNDTRLFGSHLKGDVQNWMLFNTVLWEMWSHQ